MPTITASIDGSAVKAQSLAGHRRLQPLRYLHDCSDYFRLERLPGGVCTHWKAPPFHGAHPKRTFECRRFTTGRRSLAILQLRARIPKLSVVLQHRRAWRTKLLALAGPCCRRDHVRTTLRRAQQSICSQGTNEATWRLHGICRRAFVPMSTVVTSAASDGDGAPAADVPNQRRHGEQDDRSQTGCSRLSCPRRA